MDDLRNIGRIFTAPLDFISKYFKVFVLLLIVLLIFVPDYDEEDSTPPNLAKLYLTTPIYESDSFAAQIEKSSKTKILRVYCLLLIRPVARWVRVSKSPIW